MGEGPVPVKPAASASPREDRPYLRPLLMSPWLSVTWVIVLVALFVAGLIAYYLWATGQFYLTIPPKREQAPAAPAEPAKTEEPAIRHPLEAAPAESLPALAESDKTFGGALARLIGYRGMIGLLQSDRLVMRIVATVDNLPRKSAPQRMMPLKPVPGAFEAGGGTAIAARNAARYAPYIALAEAVDARACVDLYVRFYPLFQKAYAELGYPKAYFNDRLIETIDHLLATPAPKEPIALVRPKVLYEFASPELESASAGQKILMRMGSANAAKVKVKLREIRGELAKRSAR